MVPVRRSRFVQLRRSGSAGAPDSSLQQGAALASISNGHRLVSLLEHQHVSALPDRWESVT